MNLFETIELVFKVLGIKDVSHPVYAVKMAKDTLYLQRLYYRQLFVYKQQKAKFNFLLPFRHF